MAVTGACGGRKLRTEMHVFHESTSRNKKTISNSLAWLKIRGTLSIVLWIMKEKVCNHSNQQLP